MEMDTEPKKEELLSSDKCRCCLQEGELKELWSEYMVDDSVIIYGQALVECFSLALHQPAEFVEKICESCIEQLQNANTFKKLVVESDKKLLEHIFQGEEVQMDDDEEYSQDDQQSVSDENSDYPEIDLVEGESSNVNKKTLSSEALQLELLEAAGSNEPVNTKGFKKNKRPYKTYPDQNLDKCLKAITMDVMTKSEAASYFKVPIKTIAGRLRAINVKKEDPQIAEKNDLKRENYKKFLCEIKTILKYTNATPYKSKSGRYSCAYCRKKFDEGDELRAHTETMHAGERFSGVDIFMKANWLNEIIKVDITDLRCTICPAPIDGWNDMFVHLKEKHNVELDEAYTKVIPYKLTEPLMCTLCDERSDSYSILDLHMNSHYINYICGECGDSFLAEARFKKHVEIHSTEKYKCPYCPKFFALEKYRKKHVDGVHQEGLVYKCRYCDEYFINEYRRHQHMEIKHSEKIKTISCEFCERTFTFRPYYLKHLRLSHKKRDVKPHKCTMCDKSFTMKYELKNHLKWHLGYNKQTCLICNKTFSSKQYLEKHYEKVHNDTEVLVLETDQS